MNIAANVVGVLVCSTSIALAQDLPVGDPLGTINEAGDHTPLSDNVKVFGSFRFAESCTFDPDRNLIVVMNYGVSELQAENDGFVSLVHPAGTVHTAKWIGFTPPGTKVRELELRDPLGSAVRDGVLYVADINTVRKFDFRSGQPVGAYKVPEATFLNGIAVSPEGTIYTSNTSGLERIYRITAEGEVSTFIEGEPLKLPNGVAIDNDGNIVVVNMGHNEILTFSPDGELVLTEHSHEAGNDGIVILENGTKYVSSVRYGSISRIAAGKKAKVIATGIPSAASICYDSVQNQIVVPMNNNNALAFVPLD